MGGGGEGRRRKGRGGELVVVEWQGRSAWDIMHI